eukprot:409098_1
MTVLANDTKILSDPCKNKSDKDSAVELKPQTSSLRELRPRSDHNDKPIYDLENSDKCNDNNSKSRYERSNNPENVTSEPNYVTPDLCYAMCHKHNNVSIYDIAKYITHIPLGARPTKKEQIIKILMTASPLSLKRRVIHVPSPPAIFSTFVKVYESKDFKDVYFDCYNVRLLGKFSDIGFIFSQQHFHALFENLKSYVSKTK